MIVSSGRNRILELPAGAAELFDPRAPDLVRSFAGLTYHCEPTALHQLDGMAKDLGIAQIHAKDESGRLGLKSFKALGGAYAVARLVHRWAEEALGETVDPATLTTPAVRALMADKTVTCATDGNHGRSVAAGAQIFGCRAVIFVHHHVDPERLDAMRAFGASVVIVDGNYDESVDECTRVAEQNGWQIVSDTSWPGYEEIPGYVMQGYTVMVDECISAIEAAGDRLTHVFVQAGVGGFAAAVAAYLALRCGDDRPRIVVVEPERANCLLQSARANKLTHIAESQPTIMGMLECYLPSLVAWRILERTVDAFMEIPEEAAVETMRALAFPQHGDSPIVAGESGAAGLAGLMQAARDPEARAALGLTSTSSVLIFISEGATAPAVYKKLVGVEPSVVAARQVAELTTGES